LVTVVSAGVKINKSVNKHIAIKHTIVFMEKTLPILFSIEYLKFVFSFAAANPWHKRSYALNNIIDEMRRRIYLEKRMMFQNL
jgi:hypothetical protein